MKTKNLFAWVGIILVVCVLAGWAYTVNAHSSAMPAASSLYLPLLMNGDGNVPPQNDAIVIDHRHTDVRKIPDYWVQQAKKFVIHYAHTSHGSQVLSGLEWLEEQDPKYNVNIVEASAVTLPGDTTAMRFYDGNNYGDQGDTYITPDEYWESEAGRARTRSVANTGWFDFSLWTWCSQMSGYEAENVQQYIGTLAQFESQYPDMRFIYYTGHTDGTEPGSTLWRNNDMVRQYAQQNGKVLFDFADLETYAPDGSGPYYNNGDGYCEWCDDWCNSAAHQNDLSCQALPGCSHSHGLACTLKGQAFWWLMARLAGWDGVSR